MHFLQPHEFILFRPDSSLRHSLGDRRIEGVCQEYGNPISLDYRNVKTCEEMKNLINDYITKNHEGQTHRGSGLIKENGKYILICATFNEDDKMLILSFDITNILNELLHSSDKKQERKLRNTSRL